MQVALDLATLANIAEIAGLAALAGGLVFGLSQLRQQGRQRRELAAVELVRSFQTPQFTRAAAIVLDLPADISAEEIERRGPEVKQALLDVHMTFENLGLLVYRRVVPLDLVMELMGGFALDSWNRSRARVEGIRRTMGTDKYGEWYQWLVERLAEHMPPSAHQGAHTLHRAWEP